MMNHPILQFIHLENLLAEAAGADALRVHVLEQSETITSNALARKEVTIGLCVRAVVRGQWILSWYYLIDKFSFYLYEQPVNGHGANGRSPEQERYETAWQQATALQELLVTRLRQDGLIVHTDGIIELPIVQTLIRGTTGLVKPPVDQELPQVENNVRIG